MDVELLHEIIRFLSGLEPIQRAFETIYEQRLSALASVDTPVLQRLVQEEESLQRKLRLHLRIRKTILKKADNNGFPCTDLRSLLKALGNSQTGTGGIDRPQYEQTCAWMRRVERTGTKLRRDSWSSWHVVGRSTRQFTEMRNMIALAGERHATDGHDQQVAGKGGALFDAKV